VSQSLKKPTTNRRQALFIIVLLLLAGIGLRISPSAANDARAIPGPALDEVAGLATFEVAVLAGGCFWGVQGVYQHVDGVTSGQLQRS
jgi:peptide-methionine (S)-S-oxide reductase